MNYQGLAGLLEGVCAAHVDAVRVVAVIVRDAEGDVVDLRGTASTSSVHLVADFRCLSFLAGTAPHK